MRWLESRCRRSLIGSPNRPSMCQPISQLHMRVAFAQPQRRNKAYKRVAMVYRKRDRKCEPAQVPERGCIVDISLLYEEKPGTKFAQGLKECRSDVPYHDPRTFRFPQNNPNISKLEYARQQSSSVHRKSQDSGSRGQILCAD